MDEKTKRKTTMKTKKTIEEADPNIRQGRQACTEHTLLPLGIPASQETSESGIERKPLRLAVLLLLSALCSLLEYRPSLRTGISVVPGPP